MASGAWPSPGEVEPLMEQFERDGYCVIRGCLSREHVARLNAAVEAERAGLEASPRRKRRDPSDSGRAVPGLDVRGMVLEGEQAGHPFLHLLDHPTGFAVAARALGNPNISLLTSRAAHAPAPAAPAAAQCRLQT